MHRWALPAAHAAAAVLFVWHLETAVTSHWASWAVPLALVFLVLANSIRTTRFASWLIFAIGFFGFLVVLSAFTLRWRLEPGFDAAPFYRAIGMYVAFVYISLGHLHKLKTAGGAAGRPTPEVRK